ncbi:MAG: BON domain-containing protein [Gammaproteobacteria bacterium]|nr:BON domain-containing protein [Gammaproteobacteria bacterium]
MNSTFSLLAAVALSAALLQGCAAVVVGGAATGIAVAHDRRTADTIVDDETIEVKAMGALNADKEIRDQTHLNVTSYNNVVLMTGETPTQQLGQRAYKIVSGLDKVKKVHNETVVAAPSSFGSRSNDALLTSKVKARMIATKGFDSTLVKVVSERGTVYLLGLVTQAEGKLAGEIARQTEGVQKVVKLFEYQDTVK